MYLMRAALFILFLYLLLIPCQGQKWGKITEEELAMNQIAEDPEADAVYLFDNGEMTIQKDFTLEFKRHYRIKILTEQGKDYANQYVAYYAEDRIKNLEALSFSPDGKKHELDDDEVFDQEYKGRVNWKKKTFAIPGVEIGSVIECKYRILSDRLYLLPVWRFQNGAFTRNSNISVALLPGFNYTSFTTNMGSSVPQPRLEESLIPGKNFEKQAKYIWEMHDIPALKSEPYVKAYDDYSSAIYFQLTTYDNGYRKYNYTKTWKILGEDIIEAYDAYLKKTDRYLDFTRALCAESQGLIDKVKSIYHFIQREIETSNKNIRFFSDIEEPQKVLDEKKSGASEKNLLLCALLNQINIQAAPVLICTRDEGSFNANWISVYNFNHLIVEAKIENKTYYLDTMDKYNPFGALPEKCLVTSGFRLMKNNSDVISIPAPKIKNEREIKTKVQIMENGDLGCTSTFSFSGIPAGNKREGINRKGAVNFIKNEIESQYKTAIIDTFEISALEEIDEPLTYIIRYHIPGYLQETGTYRIMDVPLQNKIEKNPFVDEKRKLPIDFDYILRAKETIEIELPQGTSVVELPKSMRVSLPKISYTTSCSQIGNSIKYTRNHNILRLQCAVSEYEGIKRFYRKIVEADQSAILLNNN